MKEIQMKQIKCNSFFTCMFQHFPPDLDVTADLLSVSLRNALNAPSYVLHHDVHSINS